MPSEFVTNLFTSKKQGCDSVRETNADPVPVPDRETDATLPPMDSDAVCARVPDDGVSSEGVGSGVTVPVNVTVAEKLRLRELESVED